MRVSDGSLQMQRMKDTVNGQLMRAHAITGKTRLVAIAAVAGVVLLTPGLTAAAPWFLPDSDDKILAEASSLIEQGRLQDSLRLLDVDGGVDRLPATGSARGDWHYLRAYVLRFTRDRVKALQETSLALRPTEFQSASLEQARVTLLRSWLYADGGDWLSAFTNVNEAATLFGRAFSMPHPAKTFTAVTRARVVMNAFQRLGSFDMALGELSRAERELEDVAPADLDREPWASAMIALSYTEGDALLEKRQFAEAGRYYAAAVERDKRAQAAAPAEHAAVLRHVGLVVPYWRDIALSRSAVAFALAGQPAVAKQRYRDAIQFAAAQGGADRAVSAVATGLTLAISFRQCDLLMLLSEGAIPEMAEPPTARRLHSMLFNQLGVCQMVSGGHTQRAADMFAESIKDLDGIEGVPQPERATPLQNYAWALATLGKHSEAITPSRQALQLRRASLARADPRIAESASTLAGSIVMSERFATDPALKAEATDAVDLILDEGQYRTTAKPAYASAACINGSLRPGGTSFRDVRAVELCRSQSQPQAPRPAVPTK